MLVGDLIPAEDQDRDVDGDEDAEEQEDRRVCQGAEIPVTMSPTATSVVKTMATIGVARGLSRAK